MAEHGPTVLRVCRAVLGPVEAEDAWSETFLAALQAYPTLRPDSNIEAWLVTIAHRKALDQRRAQARAPISTEGLLEGPSREGATDGWETHLRDALQALPLKQRQAVAYRYLAGLPYAEIARISGNSEVAARRAAADDIKKLRTVSTFR